MTTGEENPVIKLVRGERDMQNSFFKGALAFIIIAILIIVALKVLKFAIFVVLPIAIVAFIAYAIYLAVTGKRA
jgi:predicted RND superfamily exporter protein